MREWWKLTANNDVNDLVFYLLALRFVFFCRVFCRVSLLISFSSCHRVAAKLPKLKILFAAHSLFYDFQLQVGVFVCELAAMRSMHRFRDFIFWIYWLLSIDSIVKLAISGMKCALFSITNHFCVLFPIKIEHWLSIFIELTLVFPIQRT